MGSFAKISEKISDRHNGEQRKEAMQGTVLKKQIVGLVSLIALGLGAEATIISINITNGDAPRQIGASESTGVLDVTGWLNVTADSTNIGGTAVDVTLSKAPSGLNTSRDSGVGDGTDGFLALYEGGLRDSSGATLDDTFATLSDMTAFLASEGAVSYNVYAYYKSAGPNWDPDNVAIGLSGGSMTTVNPDGGTLSVSDAFVEAGTPESNYMVFSGLTADSTTVFFSRVSRDGLLTGLQIETVVPEPSAIALILCGGLVLVRLRR